MSTQLPDYVASARPMPRDKRTPWYASTAPTYAGIFLWFVFWHQLPMLSELVPGTGIPASQGGALSQGLGIALLALIVAALICHYLFYLIPGKLGVQTGLPLYIVGTSTYGVQGGFIMPGFLMGVLQFGWLAVNAFFTTQLLCKPFGAGPGTVTFSVVAIAFVVLATLIGIKGIQYVGRVATYLPLLPLTILVVLTIAALGGVTKFDHKKLVEDGATPYQAQAASEAATAQQSTEAKPVQAQSPLDVWSVFLAISAYVVGFFATAGAAGVDFGMGNRDENDVKWGGLVGIAGAIILTGGLSLVIAAGAVGGELAGKPPVLQTTLLMEKLAPVLGEKAPAVFWYLLAIAAFPPACFSSFIAANSFKTTLPKVNPFVSCGIGALASILLVLSGYAGDAVKVFSVIGASFGPVCGAMAADYFLAGNRWAGPRAGFNPAGWISWVLGFCVGAANLVLNVNIIPCPPVAAFLVGFIVYIILAFAGLESRSLEMPRDVH